MKKHKIRYLSTLIIFFSILITWGIFNSYKEVKGAEKNNEEIELNIDISSDIEECQKEDAFATCLYKKAENTAKEKGVGEGLLYVKKVNKNLGYGYAHIILHLMGHFAYTQAESDFHKAMSFIPEKMTEETYFYYDGYIHGVMQSYFEELINSKSIESLITEVCQSDETINNSEKAGEDCYHSVGHGLMYSNGNDLKLSLKQCEIIENSGSQKKCFDGVFMEQTYLYMEEYHQNTPKTYQEKSLLPFCLAADERYKLNCANFVGNAYLLVNEKNYQGAIEACLQFKSEKYTKTCLERLALINISQDFKNNPEAAKEICQMAQDFEQYCVDKTWEGINFIFQ